MLGLLRAGRSLQGPPLLRGLAFLVGKLLECTEIAASARRNDIIIVIVVIFFISSEIGIHIFSSLPAARKADVRDVVHRAHRADSRVLTVGRDGTNEGQTRRGGKRRLRVGEPEKEGERDPYHPLAAPDAECG